MNPVFSISKQLKNVQKKKKTNFHLAKICQINAFKKTKYEPQNARSGYNTFYVEQLNLDV